MLTPIPLIDALELNYSPKFPEEEVTSKPNPQRNPRPERQYPQPRPRMMTPAQRNVEFFPYPIALGIVDIRKQCPNLRTKQRH